MFLCTVIKEKNDTYRLSISSATKEELKNSKEVRYFTSYPDVSSRLKEIFSEPFDCFSTRNGHYNAYYVPIFSCRWGTYRSIFIPMRSETNVTYVVRADIDISCVKALLRENTLQTIFEFIIFTLAILPILIAYIHVIKEKNLEYLRIHSLYLEHSKHSMTGSFNTTL